LRYKEIGHEGVNLVSRGPMKCALSWLNSIQLCRALFAGTVRDSLLMLLSLW